MFFIYYHQVCFYKSYNFHLTIIFKHYDIGTHLPRFVFEIFILYRENRILQLQYSLIHVQFVFYFSGIGCGVPMLGLAGYMYRNAAWTANGETAVATWIPIACLFVFYACSTIGYLIVPWVMIGEVFPRQIRGMIGGVSTCVGHFSIFIVLQTYPMFQDWLTTPGTFAMYGIISLLSLFFFYFFCPETKGKTLQEIEESFGTKKTRKPIVVNCGHRNGNIIINNNSINNSDKKFAFPDVIYSSPKCATAIENVV